ncbi:MAG: porin [Reichenbachiella sp.]
MKLITKLLLVAFLATSFMATAQDEEESEGPELSISGSVDAYYRANLNSANDGSGSAPGSSFANQNGFALGMANVIIGLDGEKTGFVADFVYGPRGSDAVFNSPQSSTSQSSNIVNQLYAYWNVSDAVTLTMGNFNTFLGYEVISPSANFNYSTSYMFSYGPFSHTGLKMDISASDDLSFMLALLNPTDFTEFNPTGNYSIGAQVGYKGVYLNLLYGDQTGDLDALDELFQVDLTAGFDLSDAFYLGLNATYQITQVDDSVDPAFADADGPGFYGAAAYLQYSISDAFALGTRVEYFSEQGQYGAIGPVFDADGKANVIDITLTGQYKVGDLTVIPEIRFDAASEDQFTDADGEASSGLASFVLAAVYTF